MPAHAASKHPSAAADAAANIFTPFHQVWGLPNLRRLPSQPTRVSLAASQTNLCLHACLNERAALLNV